MGTKGVFEGIGRNFFAGLCLFFFKADLEKRLEIAFILEAKTLLKDSTSEWHNQGKTRACCLSAAYLLPITF